MLSRPSAPGLVSAACLRSQRSVIKWPGWSLGNKSRVLQRFYLERNGDLMGILNSSRNTSMTECWYTAVHCWPVSAQECMSLSVRLHGFLAVTMKLGCHDSVMFDADLLLYMFCWQRWSSNTQFWQIVVTQSDEKLILRLQKFWTFSLIWHNDDNNTDPGHSLLPRCAPNTKLGLNIAPWPGHRTKMEDLVRDERLMSRGGSD